MALDVGGDGERLDGVEVEPTLLAPSEEAVDGPHVGIACVFIPDGGSEEFKKAPSGAGAFAGDDRRREGLACDVGRPVLGYQQLGSGHVALYNIQSDYVIQLRKSATGYA